jgi:hypothetical protein
MRKVKISAALALSLLAASAVAQQARSVESRVVAATVFLRGAEVTQTARLTLEKGVSEITIEGLSPMIDLSSVRINIGGGVVVSAHEFTVDHLSTAATPSARVKMLRDSIGIYRDLISRVNVDIKINSQMQSYLETGIAKNVSGSESGLGVDELKKTMDYFKAKSEEILTGARQLEKRRTDLQTALAQVTKQFNEEGGAEGKSSGMLRLNLSAPAAGTFPATVTYFTPAASWSPYYDINAAGVGGPISIAARSRVSQTTGLDWENVRLTLSTSTPSNGRVAPLFSTWFLRERPAPATRPLPVMRAAAQNSYSYAADITVRGVVTDQEGSRLTGVMVSSPAGTAVTNATGEYSIGALSGGQLSFSYLGYETLSIPVNGRTTINAILEEDSAAFEDVVVVGYGAQRKESLVEAVDETVPTIYDHVTAQTGALNVTYNIDLPYNIPGNGKEQSIDLAAKETPAEYKYYCAPRLDGATYLIAEISNWESLGLLSAPANITYDGTYIGQTQIDASATQEKLTLTLGTDKRVAVTRELAREFSSTRATGSTTEQTFAWRITVRNSQTRPVEIVLKDQYPTSTDRAVTVTLDTKNTTPWTTNREDLGVVTWEGGLQPGEVRVHTFSYTVKYPREMRLDL